MINQAPKMNRRRETRFRTLTGQRMNWQGSNTLASFRKGWVLDVSQSGLGLMVEDDKLPQVGDEIRVKIKPASAPLAYEVVRIQNEKSRIAVVGCERVYGRTARLDLPKPAWQMSRAA